MRTHFVFFLVAFIALIWYACLNFAVFQGAHLVVILFMALPWCFIVGLWIHSEDRYDAGYRIGHTAGELKGTQSGNKK